MAKNEIYPAALKYLNVVAETSNNVYKNGLDNGYLVDDVKRLSQLLSNMKLNISLLESMIKKAQTTNDSPLASAYVWRNDVLGAMNSLREVVDEIETLVDSAYWPIPTYVDLMFSV